MTNSNPKGSRLYSKLKKVSAFIIVVLLASFGSALGKMFIAANANAEKSDEIENSLNVLAENVNKLLPKLVDSDTEMVSVTAYQNQLTFNYRIVNYKLHELDIVIFDESMLPQLFKSYCTGKETAIYRKAGVKIIYSYTDTDGQFISSFNFNKTDCE